MRNDERINKKHIRILSVCQTSVIIQVKGQIRSLKVKFCTRVHHICFYTDICCVIYQIGLVFFKKDRGHHIRVIWSTIIEILAVNWNIDECAHSTLIGLTPVLEVDQNLE